MGSGCLPSFPQPPLLGRLWRQPPWKEIHVSGLETLGSSLHTGMRGLNPRLSVCLLFISEHSSLHSNPARVHIHGCLCRDLQAEMTDLPAPEAALEGGGIPVSHSSSLLPFLGCLPVAPLQKLGKGPQGFLHPSCWPPGESPGGGRGHSIDRWGTCLLVSWEVG